MTHMRNKPAKFHRDRVQFKQFLVTPDVIAYSAIQPEVGIFRDGSLYSPRGL